jgi:hypothetical protein
MRTDVGMTTLNLPATSGFTRTTVGSGRLESIITGGADAAHYETIGHLHAGQVELRTEGVGVVGIESPLLDVLNDADNLDLCVREV